MGAVGRRLRSIVAGVTGLVSKQSMSQLAAGRLARRQILGVAASLPVLSLPAVAWGQEVIGAPTRFSVRLRGVPIGVHQVRFLDDGGDLIVETAIDLELTVAFVSVFTFTHRNTERWRDGRLIALDSTTHDTGDEFFVTGRATDEGVQVDGTRGGYLAPPDIMTTSLWNPDIVNRTSAIDTQKGELFEFRVQEGPQSFIDGDGGRIVARSYRFEGDLNIEVWYDVDQEVAGVAFNVREHPITYRRLRGDD